LDNKGVKSIRGKPFCKAIMLKEDMDMGGRQWHWS